MRKISIGIFTVVTVILFFLSTSVSVTATTHEATLMILDSNVMDEDPKAIASMTPQNIWAYANWNWTVDINDGDNINISTTCNYQNDIQYGTDTGYHHFLVNAVYKNGPDERGKETDFNITTTIPDSDTITLYIQFDVVYEGGVITIYWDVLAINYWENPDVERQNYGTGYVTLT